MNTFGHLFRLTSFGESHGPLIGGVVDGMPAGIRIDEGEVAKIMSRRRPGRNPLTSLRDEEDKVHFVSGILDNVSTGSPIAFFIENKDHHSPHYDHLKDLFRPGHADLVYHVKYEGHRDWRGGGRSSARETAVRCVGGALASMLLKHSGVSVNAFVSKIGKAGMTRDEEERYLAMDSEELYSLTASSRVYCPDEELSNVMAGCVEDAKSSCDSIGGIVSCVAKGVPAGWGEPVYDRLDAMLAGAMLGINAVKGFEIGAGFSLASMYGSEANDPILVADRVSQESNHCGGMLGGISNGRDIVFRVAFKPTPTIGIEQDTINVSGEPVRFRACGRHDPAVVIRGSVVVEAMTLMTLADAYLMSRATKAFK